MSELEKNDEAMAQRQRLYDSGDFSDITLCYGEERFHAHKAILSLSSKYFHRAFTGGFKEATEKEMHLSEDDPEAVAGMLRHIYGIGTRKATKHTLFAIELMVIADKYDVPTLRATAKTGVVRNLEYYLRAEPTTMVPYLLPSLARAIWQAPVCDEKIRRLSVEVFQKDLKAWLKESEFQELLLDIPQISVDLLTVVADKVAKAEAEASAQ